MSAAVTQSINQSLTHSACNVNSLFLPCYSRLASEDELAVFQQRNSGEIMGNYRTANPAVQGRLTEPQNNCLEVFSALNSGLLCNGFAFWGNRAKIL